MNDSKAVRCEICKRINCEDERCKNIMELVYRLRNSKAVRRKGNRVIGDLYRAETDVRDSERNNSTTSNNLALNSLPAKKPLKNWSFITVLLFMFFIFGMTFLIIVTWYCDLLWWCSWMK
jgi:hypothetical protein